MTASSNVFDILELTTLIADDLTQHDLTACCLVNHAWYNTFTPHLWHSITIQSNDPTPKFQTSSGLAGLARNGHFIRVLRTYSLHTLKPFIEHGVTCTNLVSLDAEYDPSGSWPETFGMKGRTPAMRARGRRGSVGAGQRQVQMHEEGSLHGSAGRGGWGNENDHVEEQDMEKARVELEKIAQARRADMDEYRRSRGIVAQLEGGGGEGSEGEFATTFYFEGEMMQLAQEISQARRKEEADSILMTMLERNPRVEFVIVPEHCLQNAAVVKVAAVSLLCLKEFYSGSRSRGGGLPQFVLSAGRRKPPSSRNVPSFALSSQQKQRKAGAEREGQVLNVEGFLSCKNIVPVPLMEEYPRLKNLELEMIKSMNQWQMRRIRTSNQGSEGDLVCLEISNSQPSEIIQILHEAPEGLTSITILQFRCPPSYDFCRTPFDKIGKTQPVFLKHAPTLEHFFARACAIDSKALQELLCFSPRLRSLEVLEEDLEMCVHFAEAELDAADAVLSPWVCEKLEVFECKISGVPRPDVTWSYFYHEKSHFPYPTIPPHPQGPAIIPGSPKELIQRESHALQRNILTQIGRLTHLRVLTLGSERPDYDSHEFYQLVVHGIGTMIVGCSAQYSCLELSLESGLDELSGLKELEELNVGQMGHRIGLAEVQWMVAHWPKLKRIVGLRCMKYNSCFNVGGNDMLPEDEEAEAEGGDRQGTGAEEEDPEHVAWIRKHRPDINCPDPKKK